MIKIDRGLNLLEKNPIKIDGWSGETLQNLKTRRSFWRAIKTEKPSIVVIMVGSNDLCDYKMQIEMLSGQLINLAGSLKGRGVKRVIFAPILPRFRTPFNGYNKKVHQCNLQLQAIAKVSKHVQSFVSFVRFKGFTKLPIKEFYVDGIHLSDMGNKLLYRNMRSAIIKALNMKH